MTVLEVVSDKVNQHSYPQWRLSNSIWIPITCIS